MDNETSDASVAKDATATINYGALGLTPPLELPDAAGAGSGAMRSTGLVVPYYLDPHSGGAAQEGYAGAVGDAPSDALSVAPARQTFDISGKLEQNSYTRRPFSSDTVDRIAAMSPYINYYSAKYGVSPLAVGGSIAEEYDSRGNPFIFGHGTGAKGYFYDQVQDRMIPNLPDSGSGHVFEGLFPAYTGSPRWLTSDVGAGNVRLGTALRLWQAAQQEFPTWVDNKRKLAAYVISDQGNAQVAAMYTAKGQQFVRSLLPQTQSVLPDDYYTALQVDYFREGPETLLDRVMNNRWIPHFGNDITDQFLSGELSIPDSALPHSGLGARVINNRKQLQDALGIHP
jgi:hypothetical protein